MTSKFLLIPTLSDFADAFRPMMTKPASKAFLFHPRNEEYRLEGQYLFRKDEILTPEQIQVLAKDSSANLPIEENVLIYGIFSYLWMNKGLAHDYSFDIGLTDISRYFGITMGEKGFHLLEKLKSLESVYAVWAESGEVFPLLTVERIGSKLRLTSVYMHQVLNGMQGVHHDADKQKPYYYSALIHPHLIASRNKTAALIVIELVRLLVTSSASRKPNITLITLEQYVPQLRAIRLSSINTSRKNRDLKRIFRTVYRLLRTTTRIYSAFKDFELGGVYPTVNDFRQVIQGRHSGYAGNGNEVQR